MTKGILVLVLALLCLSGCNGSKLSDLASGIQDQLGIAVNLKTGDDDVCATRQAAQLISDYQALSDADRDSVRVALAQKYKAITVNPTAHTQTVWGQAYVVNLNAGDEPISREITNELDYQGAAPQTQIKTDSDQLVITTQSALHRETVTTAWASNTQTYQSVLTPQDFDQAVKLGALTQIHVSTEPSFSCGRLVHLKDVL